jgi:uncharacterized membrane protein YagU involved in acid resistance
MRDRGFAASGLVVAALGFGLSRFSVALGARETTAAFLFGGLVPLVLGLALAAGGVFLAIGSFERGFVRTVTAWCVAGVAMAAVMAGLGGELLEIGELYGIDEFAVALLTHEFHSVAFGLVYVGLLAALGSTVSRDLSGRMALGVGLALALWLVASGFVMPLWLEFLEHGATVPNLTLASLVGHVVWGGTTALCYHAGEGLMTRSGLPAFGRSDPVD